MLNTYISGSIAFARSLMYPAFRYYIQHLFLSVFHLQNQRGLVLRRQNFGDSSLSCDHDDGLDVASGKVGVDAGIDDEL